MPSYKYKCDEDHVTRLIRPVDERDEPAECLECGGEAVRNLMDELRSRAGDDDYENFKPYFDENLANEQNPDGVYVESRSQKRKLKDQQNLREKGSFVE